MLKVTFAEIDESTSHKLVIKVTEGVTKCQALRDQYCLGYRVLDHEQQQAGRSVRHSAQWGMSLFFGFNICASMKIFKFSSASAIFLFNFSG